jgi:hypothetical protein
MRAARDAIVDFVQATVAAEMPVEECLAVFGDIPMLEFIEGQPTPSLSVPLLHDDAEREFAYLSGAEQALAAANASGWTVVSIKRDWSTVF